MGRKPKFAKMVTFDGNVATNEMTNLKFEPENPSHLASPKKRKLKKYDASFLRRSQRVQSVATPPHSQDIDRVIEEITLTESEKEDEEHIDEMTELQKKSLEEIVDDLVEHMETQKYFIDAFTSKVKSTFQSETHGAAALKYKRLYASSQIKLAALEEENKRLRFELEIACSRHAAFEKGIQSSSEMLVRLKDVLLLVTDLMQRGRRTRMICNSHA